MTKYVLNSGGAKRAPELKRDFHREIVKDLGANPKILLCNFAQGREYWEIKFDGYANSIREDMPEGIAPEFQLAMPDALVAQCEWADVIYFHGGDDHLLTYWVTQFDYMKLFENKVVATGSASSDMLTTSYWTCDWRACGDGLGILPIKFIPHFESAYGDDDPRGLIDWQAAYDELANYGDTSLPVFALKEGEFIVREV